MDTAPAELYREEDPLGWRSELLAALSQSALGTFSREQRGENLAARRAAYRLAAALGSCRLFGVDLGGQDGTLPIPVAQAAAEQWGEYLAGWIGSAGQLGSAWDETDEEIEANDLCFDLLETRMESWAVFLAIDEAYQSTLEQNAPERTLFAELIDRLLVQLATFDTALQKAMALLSLVADSFLLKNWRHQLAEPYRQLLPWWLDGTLEAVAENLKSDALSWHPRVRGDSIIMLLKQCREGYDTRQAQYAMAAAPKPVESLDPQRAALNARSYRVENDIEVAVTIDLASDQQRLMVALSGPGADSYTRAVLKIALGTGPNDSPLRAGIALFRIEREIMDHLIALEPPSGWQLLLVARDGETRQVLFQDALT